MSKKYHITTTVNGDDYEYLCEAQQTLLDVLRDELQLAGTKEGCATGDCGACTVTLADLDPAGRLRYQPVNACILCIGALEGKEVITVEGLKTGDSLHPVQQAMVECHGSQCGFCTPGMIMQSIDLLNDNPNPSEEEIRLGLEGNLCRCTGYHNIVKAVQTAAGNVEA